MRNVLSRIAQAGPFLIVIAAALWSLDGILRRSLFGLAPQTIVFYEPLIGFAILLPFLWRKRERFSGGEWSAIIFVSLLSGLLGTLWFTAALLKTGFIPFSVVFLIQKLQPIFAIATARILLRERISARFLGFAALALGAAYFVTFPGGRVSLGSGMAGAALLALGAAFAWGTSTAFSRFTLLAHSPTLVTGIRFGLTALLTLGYIAIAGTGKELGAVAAPQFGTMLVIAFSSGLVALWIYYRGLKRTKASISTILELVYPLLGVIIDLVLYHTVLRPSQYLAAAVLLYAVYKISKLNREGTRFEAQVIPGRGEGAKLGFPTLNLDIPRALRAPHGIYAGWVWVGETKYPAALHYGPIPAYGLEKTFLEAHIVHDNPDARPEKVSFVFTDYLREVRSFPDAASLAAEIAKDVEEAKHRLGVTPSSS